MFFLVPAGLCRKKGYSYATDRGYSIDLARTMALNTLVVMEIFHLFFIRNIYGTSLTWKAVRGTKIVWIVAFSVFEDVISRTNIFQF